MYKHSLKELFRFAKEVHCNATRRYLKNDRSLFKLVYTDIDTQ